MATGEREMAWFMDTYSQQVGHPVPEIVTGKPLVLGGTEGRDVATGLGVVFCIEDVLKAPRRAARRAAGRRSRASATSARSWRASSRRAARRSSAVSDVTGGVVDHERPRRRRRVATWVAEHRFLRGFPAATTVGRREVLETPCDILVPGGARAPDHRGERRRARLPLVVEAANGPTTPEADEILAERGHRGDPRRARERRRRDRQLLRVGPGPAEVLLDGRRDRRAAPAPAARGARPVVEAASASACDWRTAAQSVAIERVAEAAGLRTIYP